MYFQISFKSRREVAVCLTLANPSQLSGGQLSTCLSLDLLHVERRHPPFPNVFQTNVDLSAQPLQFQLAALLTLGKLPHGIADHLTRGLIFALFDLAADPAFEFRS